MANELGVELGWYRHVVGSLHVYEKQFSENLFDGPIDSTYITNQDFDRTSGLFLDDLWNLNNKCFPKNNETLKFMTRNYEESKAK